MVLKHTLPDLLTVIDILSLLRSIFLLLPVVVLFVSELESISWRHSPGAKKQNRTFGGSFQSGHLYHPSSDCMCMCNILSPFA